MSGPGPSCAPYFWRGVGRGCFPGAFWGPCPWKPRRVWQCLGTLPACGLPHSPGQRTAHPGCGRGEGDHLRAPVRQRHQDVVERPWHPGVLRSAARIPALGLRQVVSAAAGLTGPTRHSPVPAPGRGAACGLRRLGNAVEGTGIGRGGRMGWLTLPPVYPVGLLWAGLLVPRLGRRVLDALLTLPGSAAT